MTIMMDTGELRRVIAAELEERRRSSAPGDFAYTRGSDEHLLYGATGAANLYAELGIDFGGFAARQAWCERINDFQGEDGSYHCVSGPVHAAAMAILALNILGGHPARPVRHLAPLRADALATWLDSLNWTGSTHKNFCSAVTPILASGFGDAEWVATLRANVDGRLDPQQPMRIWSDRENDHPWRVISCLYHVTCAYDAAYIPYPHPDLLWDRLAALRYEETRNDHHRTYCTDFDYAWMLVRLAHQLPDMFPEVQRRCGAVLDLMIAEWHDDRDYLLRGSTHDMYCQCIGWAIFQRLLPERFTGPGLQDTLNVPWLHRLPGPEWVAQD